MHFLRSMVKQPTANQSSSAEPPSVASLGRTRVAPTTQAALLSLLIHLRAKPISDLNV